MKKLLLIILLMFATLPLVSASLTDGLVAYYAMDGATDAERLYNDVTGEANITKTGSPIYDPSGKRGGSWNVTGSGDANPATDRLNIVFNQAINSSTNSYTICYWGRYPGTFTPPSAGYQLFFFGNTNTTDQGSYISTSIQGALDEFVLGTNNVTDNALSAAYNPSLTNDWVYTCYIYDAGERFLIYENNILVINSTINAPQTIDPKLPQYFSFIGGGPSWYGTTSTLSYDEIGFWNRTLNESEITQLSNGDEGSYPPFIPDTTPPIINFSSGTTPNSSYIGMERNIFVNVSSNDTYLNYTRINFYDYNGTLITVSNRLYDDASVNNIATNFNNFYDQAFLYAATPSPNYVSHTYSFNSIHRKNTSTVLGTSFDMSVIACIPYGTQGSAKILLGDGNLVNDTVTPSWHVYNNGYLWDVCMGRLYVYINNSRTLIASGIPVLTQGTYISGTPVPAANYGPWYYISFYKDGNYIKLYHNNVLVANVLDTNYTLTNTTIYGFSTEVYNAGYRARIALRDIKDVITPLTTSTNNTLSWNFTDLSDGRYYYNATAYDIAGNSNTTATWHADIVGEFDTAAYTTVFPYPNNAYTKNNTLTYGFTTSDTYYDDTTYTIRPADSPEARICYQESVNVSNQTGIDNCINLSYSGTIALDQFPQSSPVNLSAMFDGDWNTGTTGTTPGIGANVYENYVFPTGLTPTSAILQYKVVNYGILNTTIPKACFDYAITQNKLELKFQIINGYDTSNGTNILCKADNTPYYYTYVLQNAIGLGAAFYEDALYWKVGEISVNNGTQVTFSNLDDGKYYYDLTMFDKASNYGYYDPNITIDTTTPIINFSTGTTPNGSYLTSKNININLSITDDNPYSTIISLYNSTGLVDIAGEDTILYDDILINNLSKWNAGNLGHSIFTWYAPGYYAAIGALMSTLQRNITDTPVIGVRAELNFSVCVASAGEDTGHGAILLGDGKMYTGSALIHYENGYRYDPCAGTISATVNNVTTILDTNAPVLSLNISHNVTFYKLGDHLRLYVDDVLMNDIIDTRYNTTYNPANNPTTYAFHARYFDIIYGARFQVRNIYDIVASNYVNVEHDFVNLSNGRYYYNATTYDAVGYINSTVTWQADIVGNFSLPYYSVTVKYPTGTYTNDTSYYVIVNNTDPYFDYWNVSITFNDQTNISTDPNLRIDYEGLTDGRHNVTIIATDQALNTYLWQSYIIIDTVSPIINFSTGTTPNGTYIAASKTINVNLSVNDTNLENVTINLYNTTGIYDSIQIVGGHITNIYDDFNDASINTSKWTVIQGSAVEENGYLRLGTEAEYSFIISAQDLYHPGLDMDNPTIIIDTNVSMNNGQPEYAWQGFGVMSNESLTTACRNNPYVCDAFWTVLTREATANSKEYYGISDGANVLYSNYAYTNTNTVPIYPTYARLRLIYSKTTGGNWNLWSNLTTGTTSILNLTTNISSPIDSFRAILFARNGYGPKIMYLDYINITLSGTLGTSYTFTNLPNGKYYYNATATDIIGQSSNTDTWEADIVGDFANGSYEVTTKYPPGIYTNDTTYYIIGNSTDTYFNYWNITLNLQNNASNESNYRVDYEGLSDGYKAINITATDLAENTYLWQTYYTIDATPPTINFSTGTTPNGSYIAASKTITVNLSVNDTNLNTTNINLYNDTGVLIDNKFINHQAESLQDNLKIYYDFDEPNGTTLIDTSNNGFSIAQTGSVNRSEGILGNAGGNWSSNSNYYRLTNTNVSGLFNMSKNFSVNVWYVTYGGGYKRILEKGDVNTNFNIVVHDGYPTGDIYYGVTSCFFQLGGPTTHGLWTMLTVTYDGTNISLWQNNVFVNTADVSGCIGYFTPSTVLTIGHTGPGDTQAFNGYIDELSYWDNKILTPTEIATLYNTGAALNFNDLTTSKDFTNLAVGKYYYNATAIDLVGQSSSTATWEADIVGDFANGSYEVTTKYPPGTYTNDTTYYVIANTTDAYFNYWNITLNEQLSEDLIAYFPMEETSGDIYSTINGYVGTQQNTVSSSTGIIGNARNTDGVLAFFITNIPATAIPAGDSVSINAWYKGSIADYVQYGGLVTIRDGSMYPALMFSDIHNITGAQAGTPAQGVAIEDDTWHMYTSVINAATNIAYFYIDGALVSIGSNTNDMSTSNTWYIGSEGFNPVNRNINGELDEIGIWGKALSSTDINKLYNSGTGLRPIMQTNNSATPNFRIDYEGLIDGIYTNDITATDLALNTYLWQNYFTIDTTYPLISFTIGTTPNNSVVQQSNIYVNLSIVEANINTTTINLYNSTGGLLESVNPNIITYYEDFEDGLAQDWTLYTGIAVTNDNPIAGLYSLNFSGYTTGNARITTQDMVGVADMNNYTFTLSATISANDNAMGILVMGDGGTTYPAYCVINNAGELKCTTPTETTLLTGLTDNTPYNISLIIHGLNNTYDVYFDNALIGTYSLGTHTTIDTIQIAYWNSMSIGKADNIRLEYVSSDNLTAHNFTDLVNGRYYYNATVTDLIGYSAYTDTWTTYILANFSTNLYTVTFPYPDNAYTTNNTLTYGFSTTDPYYNYTNYYLQAFNGYPFASVPCFQESFNTTNQNGNDGVCGLYYNGTSNIPTIFNDGNYTSGFTVNNSMNYYINYTLPLANNQTRIIVWQIKEQHLYPSGGGGSIFIQVDE